MNVALKYSKILLVLFQVENPADTYKIKELEENEKVKCQKFECVTKAFSKKVAQRKVIVLRANSFSSFKILI